MQMEQTHSYIYPIDPTNVTANSEIVNEHLRIAFKIIQLMIYWSNS